MGILDFVSGLLEGSVGNNMENKQDDVRKTKRHLQDAGYFDEDVQEVETPFITRKMDEGIKAFQQDQGLKVDGILRPGGETERGLFKGSLNRHSVSESGDDLSVKGDDMSAQAQENPKKNDRSAIGGFGQVAQNVDATGRMITDDSPPIPERKPLDSPFRPPILKGVDNKTVIEEVVKHETPIFHMYKDSAKGGGRVTVGTGFLLNNVEDAKKLPFTVPDRKGGRRPATDVEIERAFEKIKNIHNDNHKAKSFEPGKGQKALENALDDLRLPEDAERRILDVKIRERARDAMQKLKNDGINPNGLPPSIKKLVFDLQYNNGLGGPKSRAHLFNPIRNRNWAKVKEAVRRYPIDKERDAWRLKQVDEAQAWERIKGTK
ncbi:MAG: peptidoglycan-binding domain-containing protein [Alphaproteobacteria bacterium]